MSEKIKITPEADGAFEERFPQRIGFSQLHEGTWYRLEAKAENSKTRSLSTLVAFTALNAVRTQDGRTEAVQKMDISFYNDAYEWVTVMPTTMIDGAVMVGRPLYLDGGGYFEFGYITPHTVQAQPWRLELPTNLSGASTPMHVNAKQSPVVYA